MSRLLPPGRLSSVVLRRREAFKSRLASGQQWPGFTPPRSRKVSALQGGSGRREGSWRANPVKPVRRAIRIRRALWHSYKYRTQPDHLANNDPSMELEHERESRSHRSATTAPKLDALPLHIAHRK